MTFDEVYQIVEESSHETAFNREECQALYDLAIQLDPDSLMVEIGVQFGRSLTVLASVAKQKDLMVIAIDNWSEEYSVEAEKHVREQIRKYEWPVQLWNVGSDSAAKIFRNDYRKSISVLHIDGDHTYEGVTVDCNEWCPEVKVGGHVCFDDYGHDSLPTVYKAVCEYMAAHDEWEFVGRYGNKLGIFKKIK
jgi:cephalosporin hydroxylase